ncbi:MAG: lysostaphin resistance A-like protein [Candidatus Thorarchaeota archaeon]
MLSEVIEITVLEAMTPENEEKAVRAPFWTRTGLIALSGIMLFIGSVMRVIDIFVLGLGDDWINILPSKLIPLLILVTVFLKYRTAETESILGLSRYNVKSFIVFGILFGVALYLTTDVLSFIVYAAIDTTVALEFSVVAAPAMLVYTFFFFAVNAIYEETLFRGLIQNSFAARYGSIPGILISAAIFGVWHITWPFQRAMETGIFPVGEAVVMVVFSGILGAVFGICYDRYSARKTLVGTITAHTLLNYFNENLKFALDTGMQGPDLSFVNSTHMAIGLLFALGFFIFSIIYFWRYRLDDVVSRIGRMRS